MTQVMKDQVATYLDGCNVYDNGPRCILPFDYGVNDKEVMTAVVDERQCSCETSRARTDNKNSSALR